METRTSRGRLESNLEADRCTEISDSGHAELDLDLDWVLGLIEREARGAADEPYIRQEVVVRVYETWTDMACAGRVPRRTYAWIRVTARRTRARECKRPRARSLECCVQMPATDNENTVSTDPSQAELLDELLPRLLPTLTPLQRLVLAKCRSCQTLDDVCRETRRGKADLYRTVLLIGKKARKFLDG